MGRAEGSFLAVDKGQKKLFVGKKQDDEPLSKRKTMMLDGRL